MPNQALTSSHSDFSFFPFGFQHEQMGRNFGKPQFRKFRAQDTCHPHCPAGIQFAAVPIQNDGDEQVFVAMDVVRFGLYQDRIEHELVPEPIVQELQHEFPEFHFPSLPSAA